jgi:precorrin-3B synthase
MSAAPAIKGWCPTLLDPMPSGDGWLARIKPSAATLTADAARLVARLAARHGNGLIDLTSRANLQMRGLTPASAVIIADEVIASGLAAADPARDAIRNVMASPLGPDDRSAAFDADKMARALEALLDDAEFERLSPKFCFLVDGGGALPLRGVRADVMIRAVDGGPAISLDDGLLAVPCTLATAAETATRLARATLRLCRELRLPPLRMRRLIETIGEEAIFAAAGLTPMPQAHAAEIAAQPPIGVIAFGKDGRGAFGIGLPFGRVDAGTLTSLAGLAECFGDGCLRTTPWRVLLIAGVALSNAEELGRVALELGLIIDPGDARLLIQACVGAPSCESATVPARADAETLAAALGPLGTLGETLHVSGCAKSCAHRGPASVTLVGRGGRYDLVREGTAKDKPALMGLLIEDAVALLAAAGGRQ